MSGKTLGTAPASAASPIFFVLSNSDGTTTLSQDPSTLAFSMISGPLPISNPARFYADPAKCKSLMSSTSTSLAECSLQPGPQSFNGKIFGATMGDITNSGRCPAIPFTVPVITLQAAGCGYNVQMTNADGSTSYLQPPASDGSLISSTPYLWTATPSGPAFTLQNPTDKSFIAVTAGTTGATTTFTTVPTSAGAAVFECLNGWIVLSGTASNIPPYSATFLTQTKAGDASATISTNADGWLLSYNISSVVDTNASVSNVDNVNALYLGPLLPGGLLSLLPGRAGALAVVPVLLPDPAQYAVYSLLIRPYENPGSYSPGTVSCTSLSAQQGMYIGIAVAAAVLFIGIFLAVWYWPKQKTAGAIGVPPK